MTYPRVVICSQRRFIMPSDKNSIKNNKYLPVYRKRKLVFYSVHLYRLIFFSPTGPRDVACKIRSVVREARCIRRSICLTAAHKLISISGSLLTWPIQDEICDVWLNMFGITFDWIVNHLLAFILCLLQNVWFIVKGVYF